MMRLFKSSKFWLIFAPVVSSVLWMRFAVWLISCSDHHEWLSSFVEVAFGLNAAVSIKWFRDKISEPLKIDLIPRLKKIVQSQTNEQAERLAEKFLKDNEDLVARLSGGVPSCIVLPVRLARLSCACAICVLLSDFGMTEYTWSVPALLIPYVSFVTILIVNWVFVLIEEFELLNRFNKAVDAIARS